MKKLSFLVLFLFLLAPAGASAHATPVEMRPHSGEQLQQAPEKVQIRFSEHLEKGSSLIRITDTTGAQVHTELAKVAEDGYTLSTPIHASSGLYTVSWSVVSKDDGHFTRGSYAFSVGSTTVSSSASEEIVKIATTKEAGLVFVEFLGNSLLWGTLALFLISGGDRRVRRVLRMLALVAALCALGGSGGQIILKTHELADFHESGFVDALHLYLQTNAGFSTMIRGIALTVGGCIAALVGFNSRRTTMLVLVPALVVFAYFRAIISHATANPFHPPLSIVVNFLHVIEKDLWLGVPLVLCALFVFRSSLAREHSVGAIRFLSANLAVLSLSAGYIVWLHLRQFHNLVSSSWGQAAIPLFVAALSLIVLHTTIVCMIRFKPRLVPRLFPPLLGAETIAAALVVFFTSIVIITSPPATTPEPIVYGLDSNGVRIELSRAPHEDGAALLSITGSNSEPTVIIGSRDGGLIAPIEKRFNGGYVFPSGLITKPDQISVIVPQARAYNADVTFEVSPPDFAPTAGHGRTFDFFTISMICIACAGVVVSVVVTRWMPVTQTLQIDRTASVSIVIGAVVSYAAVSILCLSGSHVLANRFQIACESDGNMWHLMQPTRASVPLSSIAREGCMRGMGQYPYFFADAREYDYLSSFGQAVVDLATDPEQIRVSVPTNLTFTLRNTDGTPAKLLIDMERYVHVVIVSKDETVFAHIHPDDAKPLSQESIDTSTYTAGYTFPKAGEYLVSLDYAHGTQLESKQFKINVTGSVPQSDIVKTYTSPGQFGGYDVTMDSSGVVAGEVSTLKFRVMKGGTPATALQPYLSAVSHISVVKNDLSVFMHTHGEVHTPGTPYPPIIVKNGKIIHSMSVMMSPSRFGPDFETHVLFPSSGRYTVWAQFNDGTTVIPAAFTVDVE